MMWIVLKAVLLFVLSGTLESGHAPPPLDRPGDLVSSSPGRDLRGGAFHQSGGRPAQPGDILPRMRTGLHMPAMPAARRPPQTCAASPRSAVAGIRAPRHTAGCN